MSQEEIDRFVADQLAHWPEADERFSALANVLTRVITPTGWRVTYNPARIVSSAAKVDAASIAARPCFLCRHNRPTQQMAVDMGKYELLVNPFPIFPGHLTIPTKEHTPQSVIDRGNDLFKIATELSGYTIFYNGARCGASAPDHMHFQAVKSTDLPLRQSYPFATRRLTLHNNNAATALRQALASLQAGDDSIEPQVNILARAIDSDTVDTIIIPRRRHRPANYGTGEGELLLSPASVDLGGMIVAPRRQEYDTLDADLLDQLFKQLCYETI